MLDSQHVPQTSAMGQGGATDASKASTDRVGNIAYGSEIVTGVRPTGSLTVGNYVGAIKPFLALQQGGFESLIFVADIHALTDREPDEIKMNIIEVVADYIALGINPDKTKIFVQSQVAEEVALLTTILMRHVTIAELLRLPTLKDKIRSSESPENASALLAVYPVMMAADILLQRAKRVPVGEDQIPHLEITRKIARRFNDAYGQIFPIPEAQEYEAIRILGVRGHGKMSKSNPDEAIFLSDSPDKAAQKLKHARTAIGSQMTPELNSNILIAKGLASTPDQISEIDAIIERHMAGQKVMGDFREILTRITVEFLLGFQERKRAIQSELDGLHKILEVGAAVARHNARETMDMVKAVMFGK